MITHSILYVPTEGVEKHIQLFYYYHILFFQEHYAKLVYFERIVLNSLI